MMDPKTFYRDFDSLLRKIRHIERGENFIYTLLRDFCSNFGATLHIGRMWLYEDRGDGFRKLLIDGNVEANTVPDFIDGQSQSVRSVLKNASYIFDDPDELTIAPDLQKEGHYAVPAAILIRSTEQRWIAIFELTEGWGREEVLFSLNAVRTSLNHRLFSEAINTELEQAALIQKSLLPGEPPVLSDYEIAWRSEATEIVGGDLYDCIIHDDNIFGAAIGDASGHGIPAALLVRDVVIGLRMGLEKNMKMLHTFQKLNSVIYRSTYSSRFVSLFYGEFERDGHLIFVNAGHPTPFIVDDTGTTDLNATGLIIGALPEIKLYRSFATMSTGSILVLYSDGVFERENLKEELFGIDRIKNLAIKHRHKSAQEIVNLIFEAAYEWGNRLKWDDDVTLLIIKRTGTEEKRSN
jgi:sigma-B regulation protein RsbU (phosphoserine phosphatase)